MSNNNRGATGSGHGAEGMGGQPNDDPRDLRRGGPGRSDDDLGGGTGPVPGAFGSGATPSDASEGRETAGTIGDNGIVGDIGTKSR